MSSFEGVIGGANNDVLLGSRGANIFWLATYLGDAGEVKGDVSRDAADTTR